MAKATKKQVRVWCLGVIARQGVSMSVDEVEVQMGLSVPALAARFPAEAFCAACLDHVAGTERHWNEARVSSAIAEWVRVNEVQPVSTLPPEAESAPVDSLTKRWLGHYYRATDDPTAARALDLVMAYSPEAFSYLLRHDTNAAYIAVNRGWRLPRTDAEMQAEWDDPVGISRLVRKYSDPWDGPAMNLLRSIVHRRAWQHEHLIPEDAISVAAEPVTPILMPPPVAAFDELFGG